MGRRPWCSKQEESTNKGPWSAQEDKMLADHIKAHGNQKWSSIPKSTGLRRCGKSCRLRWLNYLRPNIKRGNITQEEEDLIIRLHRLLGNRWSLIAGRIPGRTYNEIKNYWNSHLCKNKLVEPEKNPKNSDNEVNVVDHDTTVVPEFGEGSSSATSATTTEESSSDILMDFYTREISLSEFLETDFTKFGRMTNSSGNNNVTMVQEESEAKDDEEAQLNVILSREMLESLMIGWEDDSGHSDFGYQLSAAFSDFVAVEEEYWIS